MNEADLELLRSYAAAAFNPQVVALERIATALEQLVKIVKEERDQHHAEERPLPRR
jgi:hypothetical protein